MTSVSYPFNTLSHVTNTGFLKKPQSWLSTNVGIERALAIIISWCGKGSKNEKPRMAQIKCGLAAFWDFSKKRDLGSFAIGGFQHCI